MGRYCAPPTFNMIPEEIKRRIGPKLDQWSGKFSELLGIVRREVSEMAHDMARENLRAATDNLEFSAKWGHLYPSDFYTAVVLFMMEHGRTDFPSPGQVSLGDGSVYHVHGLGLLKWTEGHCDPPTLSFSPDRRETPVSLAFSVFEGIDGIAGGVSTFSDLDEQEAAARPSNNRFYGRDPRWVTETFDFVRPKFRSIPSEEPAQAAKPASATIVRYTEPYDHEQEESVYDDEEEDLD